MIAGIVIAAGRSERMGSPKALLPFRGRTFLENILGAISKSSIEQTVVRRRPSPAGNTANAEAAGGCRQS